MHAIPGSMRTWMKDGCAWCADKMCEEREEEEREMGAKVHLRVEDIQGIRLKLVLYSKYRGVIRHFLWFAHNLRHSEKILSMQHLNFSKQIITI